MEATLHRHTDVSCCTRIYPLCVSRYRSWINLRTNQIKKPTFLSTPSMIIGALLLMMPFQHYRSDNHYLSMHHLFFFLFFLGVVSAASLSFFLFLSMLLFLEVEAKWALSVLSYFNNSSSWTQCEMSSFRDQVHFWQS